MTPAISVIIPIYNAADVLGETLGYLVAQTMCDFEVLCVDDGSTDASAALVEAFAERDARFRLLRKANGGAASARNKGLERACGTYVSFLDADDIFEPTLLERLMAPLEGSGADFSCCEADIVHEGNGSPSPLFRFSGKVAQGLHERGEFGERLFQTFNKCAWNKLYRRESILRHKVRFQDLPNMNDLYFVEMMLALSETIEVVREPLICYRRGRGTSLQDLRPRRPECALRAAEQLFDDLRERDVLSAAETVSLANECWRLAIQAVESAAASRNEAKLDGVLQQARSLARRWGVDELGWRDFSVTAYAFWHWCYLRARPEGLMWAYAIDRAPVAERQTTLTNIRTALRLLMASLARGA